MSMYSDTGAFMIMHMTTNSGHRDNKHSPPVICWLIILAMGNSSIVARLSPSLVAKGDRISASPTMFIFVPTSVGQLGRTAGTVHQYRLIYSYTPCQTPTIEANRSVHKG